MGGGKSGYEEIKLIDFGMTRVLKEGVEETAMCGTPEFVGEEILIFVNFFLSRELCMSYCGNSPCRCCVKIVRIRSFFWFVSSRMWIELGDSACKSLYSVQVWRKRTRKNPDSETFSAVRFLSKVFF